MNKTIVCVTLSEGHAECVKEPGIILEEKLELGGGKCGHEPAGHSLVVVDLLLVRLGRNSAAVDWEIGVVRKPRRVRPVWGQG